MFTVVPRGKLPEKSQKLPGSILGRFRGYRLKMDTIMLKFRQFAWFTVQSVYISLIVYGMIQLLDWALE